METSLRVPARVVMVLGAGRGPLVNATLRAAQQASRKVRVYAVEKNPNTVVTYVLHQEQTKESQLGMGKGVHKAKALDILVFVRYIFFAHFFKSFFYLYCPSLLY